MDCGQRESALVGLLLEDSLGSLERNLLLTTRITAHALNGTMVRHLHVSPAAACTKCTQKRTEKHKAACCN